MLPLVAIAWYALTEKSAFHDKQPLSEPKNARNSEAPSNATQLVQQEISPIEESSEAVQTVNRLGGTVRLQANGEVIAINLTGADVGNDDLQLLTKTPKLKLLNLDNTAIGDDELKLVRDLPELQILRLCRTQITNAGMANLRTLPKLSVLLLNDTQITDEGLEPLLDVASLVQIEIMGCTVTSRMIEIFHARRPGCYVKR